MCWPNGAPVLRREERAYRNTVPRLVETQMSDGVRATLVGACEGIERRRVRNEEEDRVGPRKVWILPSDSACLSVFPHDDTLC